MTCPAFTEREVPSSADNLMQNLIYAMFDSLFPKFHRSLRVKSILLLTTRCKNLIYTMFDLTKSPKVVVNAS